VKFKEILSQLNIVAQCRRYRLSLWQCPQFLFLVMGIIIIGSSLLTYAIGTKYIEDPGIVALVVLLLATILLVIAFIVNRSFEKLAEISRMKSEFIDVVSHQLRSPLTNLKWAIDFLISGEAEKKDEYCQILKENSLRMEELVSDLMTVSRLETTTLPLQKQETSLENLIEETIFKFKPFAKSANIEIEFEPQKNLPKVLADPSQIKQVLENLLDNAIRYTKEKGKIEIKLEKKDKNLYFEIKDQGVGIPQEDQKYIFQKFFRSKNVLREKTRGSGLGLYIAKLIIERSGGKIGFKSQEGIGSTFWFILPIKN
jgi:signal transduction histidine kinase